MSYVLDSPIQLQNIELEQQPTATHARLWTARIAIIVPSLVTYL